MAQSFKHSLFIITLQFNVPVTICLNRRHLQVAFSTVPHLRANIDQTRTQRERKTHKDLFYQVTNNWHWNSLKNNRSICIIYAHFMNKGWISNYWQPQNKNLIPILILGWNFWVSRRIVSSNTAMVHSMHSHVRTFYHLCALVLWL